MVTLTTAFFYPVFCRHTAFFALRDLGNKLAGAAAHLMGKGAEDAGACVLPAGAGGGYQLIPKERAGSRHGQALCFQELPSLP
jgi:hypothetical protein